MVETTVSYSGLHEEINIEIAWDIGIPRYQGYQIYSVRKLGKRLFRSFDNAVLGMIGQIDEVGTVPSNSYYEF